MDDTSSLIDNEDHATICHLRWSERLNRRVGSPEYLDSWIDEQCGGCRFFVTLSGVLGSDYGACTNVASLFDGRVMFEHDGCEAFEWASDAWGTTSEKTDSLRRRPSDDFKIIAINALRDNTKLMQMTLEQKALAAQAFDTIGQRTKNINAPLAKLLNQERARFFEEKSRNIARTLHEFGKSEGWVTEEYYEGDRVRLKHDNLITGLKAGTEGIVRVCYDVTPLAYEISFIDEFGNPFDALMYAEELE